MKKICKFIAITFLLIVVALLCFFGYIVWHRNKLIDELKNDSIAVLSRVKSIEELHEAVKPLGHGWGLGWHFGWYLDSHSI